MNAFARFATSTLLALALAAGGICLASCSSSSEAGQAQEPAAPSESAGAFTFTDDLGNEVTVSNPQRVVACMGSFADIWQLAGGTLVGASSDSFADYGIDDSVASVGDFSALSLESILACDPDFVILTASSGGKGGGTSQTDLRESLESSGVTTAYFEVTTFDDYLRMLGVCCGITGRDDLYRQNGTDVKERIDGIIEGSAAREKKPRVAVLTTYSQGIRVQNSKTMTGSMLADLGAVNIADENPSLLSDFSMEALIEANPDYIFIVPMGNDSAATEANLAAATSDNPAWSTLSAVQEGRCVILDSSMFLYKPNERWADAYGALASAFAGESGAAN